MIKMKLNGRFSNSNIPIKNYVQCPQCLTDNFFHNWAPRYCESCNFSFGNIILLIENIRVRKYYYKKGEIN